MEKINPPFHQYDAYIFDMDGVLIDSEPLWKIAMQEAFDEVGCHLTVKDFQKTVGLRIDEVVRYWYSHSPWTGSSTEELEANIIQKMIVLIGQNPFPLPGVLETLNFLKAQGKPIGLGTSSYRVLIEAVLSALNLQSSFDFTHSAEDEAHGKPHPAVYLTVAQKLQVNPRKCLVIEDSFTGFIAGKAAQMDVLVIPEKTHAPNEKLKAADFYYESMLNWLDDLRKS
jgi:mannitol-1-/sugar-/sorbitol-6-/2-deoxyglucose-6-phosphatase